MLSREFKIQSIGKDLNGPERNGHNIGFIFNFCSQEREELKNYISDKIKDVGMKPNKIFIYKSRWDPSIFWVSYGGRKFTRKTEILYNFKMASTLITTGMDIEYEEQIPGSCVFGGGGYSETRIEAVQHNVIQSYNDIQNALDTGVKSLHSKDAYASYRRAGVDQAKVLIDQNIERLVDNSFPEKVSRFCKVLNRHLSRI